MMVKQVGVPEKWDMELDLVCVGSSSGGLVAAIVGHDLGLGTVVLEKADVLGGATAISGGAIWVPCNHHMAEMGLADSREEARMYIRGLSLGRHEEENLAAYLDNGPQMLRYIEERTPLRMAVAAFPDLYADSPGGKGRKEQQFKGRKLIPDPQLMPQVMAEAEKTHPLLHNVRPDPVVYYLGKRDFWAEGRGLTGPLVLACLDRGINILANTRARQLIVRDGRVIGVRAEREGRDFFIKGKKGILLTTGGFEWNERMWKRSINIPFAPGMTPYPNEGDGHIMGMEVGAAVALMDLGIFQVMLRIPGEEIDGKPFYRGTTYGVPGVILVNRHGKRCCNDAFWPAIRDAFVSYDPARPELANAPVFWICDQYFKDRVAIGNVRRGTQTAEWLHRDDTVSGLAEQLGIPSSNLVETVERFNTFAREGRDPDFHRGEASHDLWWGIRVAPMFPDHKGNPALGPLDKPPFYGLQLPMGTQGTLGGLVVNGNAQVMDVRGEVIPGLYAAGNTAAMLSSGHHYESGSAQGSSMILGYVAGRHVARGGK